MTYEEVRVYVNELINYGKSHNELPNSSKKLLYASGIYSITIHNIYVYIGRSTNLLERIIEHKFMIEHPEKIDIYEGTNIKYQMLNEWERDWLDWHNENCRISNHVIIKPILIQEEYNNIDLDMLEAAYIRKYLPYFNVFIPKLDGSLDYYKPFSNHMNDLADYLYDYKEFSL